MSSSARRVRIACPKCNALIASAPEDDLPTGDLVCPACGDVVAAPRESDRLIEGIKSAVSDALGAPGPRDKPD